MFCFVFKAAIVRPFLSCLCGICVTLLWIEEGRASLTGELEQDSLQVRLPVEVFVDAHASPVVNAHVALQEASSSSKNAGRAEEIATKAEAIAEISGSPHPGVIDHLLVRPLPNREQHTPMSIMLCYPSIGRKDVDTDIRQWVTEIADAFEQHFDLSAFLFDTESLNGYLPASVELKSEYTVSKPSAKAISITFELWNYTGGEHANIDVVTLNYSLINGQRIGLSDIFANPDEALQLMSQWTRTTLSNRYGSGRKQMVLTGTEPLVENFSSLTLTPTGVCINFQPYQVAGWEMGIQKVDMPLEALVAAQPLTVYWGR